MAIPFLNNLDITDNQLLNAKLHVTPTAPTAAAGQIYFNSADGVARYHNGTTWVDIPRKISVGGTDLAYSQAIDLVAGTNVGIAESSGVITISSTDEFEGTVTSVGASTTGTALDVTVTSPTTAPDLDFSWAGTASQYVDGQGDLQTFPTIPTNIVETFSNNNTGTYVAYGVTNSLATGDVSIGDVDLTAVNGTAVAGERYLTKSNTWAEVSGISGTTYDLEGVGSTNGTAGIRLAGSDATNDDVLIIGAGTTTVTRGGDTLTVTSNDEFTGTLTGVTEGPGITVTNTSATSPTVAVDYLGADNYLLEAGAATVADSDDIINFSDDTDTNVKKTTLGTIPVESLTLVKNYIDSSASGGVYYQGGYNPTTDTTSPGGYGLQTPPNPNIIEIGWMYTVTADGTFFGEQLRVGDVLIAEIDAPTSLSDWTTVQNNIDFATAGTDTGVGAAIVGISRYDEDDFTVSSTGFVQLTVPAARSGSIAVPNSSTYTYPSSITASATNSVLIQLVDGSTGETVYADVTRLSPTTFSVNYGVTTPTGVIALIQLIG